MDTVQSESSVPFPPDWLTRNTGKLMSLFSSLEIKYVSIMCHPMSAFDTSYRPAIK